MTERLFDFLDEVLRHYFGAEFDARPWLRRAELERLVADDGQRRVEHARLAAAEWATEETHRRVEVVAERLTVTPRGLLYCAEVTAGPRRRLHYLAAPPSLFEPMADRVGATHLRPGATAAVDSRIRSDLVFIWPLDRPLRRTLDADEVLGVRRV